MHAYSNAPRHDLRPLDIIVHSLVYPGEIVQQQIYVQICGKQVSLSHGIQGTRTCTETASNKSSQLEQEEDDKRR